MRFGISRVCCFVVLVWSGHASEPPHQAVTAITDVRPAVDNLADGGVSGGAASTSSFSRHLGGASTRAGFTSALTALRGRHLENADGGTSDILWRDPLDARFVILYVLGLLMALIGVTAAGILAYKHYNLGARATGSMAVDTLSVFAFNFIAAVPKLAVAGILCLLLPDSFALWAFIAAGITAQNFTHVPHYLFEISGGRMAVVLKLAEVVDDERDPVAIFPCTRPRRPTIRTLWLTRLMIKQYTVVLPFLSLLELAFEFERAQGAQFADGALAVLSTLGILQLPSTMMCAVGCGSLVKVIEYANSNFKKAAEELKVNSVLFYCRVYIIFVNLVPTLIRLVLRNIDVVLENGESLPHETMGNIGSAFALIAGTLVCTLQAKRAFPMECNALVDAAPGESARMVKMRFCPLCGRPTLAPDSALVRGVLQACCSACGAAGFSDQLYVRRLPGKHSE